MQQSGGWRGSLSGCFGHGRPGVSDLYMRRRSIGVELGSRGLELRFISALRFVAQSLHNFDRKGSAHSTAARKGNRMRVDELAEELADFWFPAIAGTGWEGRLRILKEIDSQLRSDIEARAEYEAVCPRFLAMLIERLGVPAVDNEAQAQIYSSSAYDHHRMAARIWSERTGSATPPSPGTLGQERRRFPRHPVDAVSEIWVEGQAQACRLTDLSRGGARVIIPELEPDPGTVVRVAVPEAGVLDATVVFCGKRGIGLRFSDQTAAA